MRKSMRFIYIGLMICLTGITVAGCSQTLSEPTEAPVIEGKITSTSLPPSPTPALGAETEKSITDEPAWTPEPTSTVKPPLRLNPEDIQGEILCSIYPEGGIGLFKADGSELTILLEGSSSMEINDNRHAMWLPGGKGFSYTVDDFTQAEIWVTNTQGGPGQALVEDVATYSSHTWSPDGRSIAYVSTQNQISIYNLDTQTSIELTDDHFRTAVDPDWSPDGTQIAFSGAISGSPDIYLIDVDGTDLIRATTHEGVDQAPAWSPDGTKIVFSSTRDGDHINDIFVIDLSPNTEVEGNTPRQLTFDDTLDINPDWSPDGQYIVYAAHTFGAAHATLFIINQDGTRRFQLTKDNTYHYPQWRP
jgi:Tol biopolymer transport system component